MDDANLSDPKPAELPGEAPGGAPAPPSVPRPHHPAASDRLTFDALRLPEETDAWLHVVSGPSATAVVRGALDLAGRLLGSGQRVLLVDGGPRLQLHESFDREARWGVVECLTGEMPVLGLVQDMGRPNLYLLAHGLPAPRTHWAGLGRMLDEARPHFDRAVLALDAEAPAAVGEALAGWHLEGWWAGGGRDSRRATRLADRLGVHLSELDLSAMPEVRLEALEARRGPGSAAVGDAPALADAPAPDDVPAAAAVATPGPEPVAAGEASPLPESPLPESPLPEPPLPEAPLPEAPVPEPVILGCDPQVRERLRFLLWMRRIQSDQLRAEVTRPARTGTSSA